MPADDLRLAIRIRADVQRALANMRGMERSLGNIDRRGRRADRTLRSMGRTVLRLGAAYLGLRAAVGVIRSIVGATEEQSQATAQMERGLRNLRGTTALTSAGLQEHAAGLQQVTTTGDEAIIRLQSLLLTFRQIDDSNFNRVVEASLDLAAAIGQAPRDAALQLGKALEDPVQGLTALRRSGTVFSQEQTAVIRQLAETNRLAEAQGLILAEVERQYRGAARAQRETVGGAADALSNTLGDLLEHRDGAEDLRLSIEGLNDQFKDPATRSAVRGFVDLMVDGFAAIVRGAGAAVDAVSQLIAAVHPDIDSRAERVRTFGRTGEGIRPADLAEDERLRAEAERQLAALQESIAQRQAQIAEQDSALFRRERDIAAANRAAAGGAALGIEELLSGGRAQTLADQEREELNRQQRDLEAQRAAARRLDQALRLASFRPNVPAGFTLPGRLPPGVIQPPAEPGQDAAARAAEQVAAQIEAIRAQHEDRLARLTLNRIALVDRAEREALADLDRLAAAEGADQVAIEAARTAVVASAEAERAAIRRDAAREAADAADDALAAEAEAQADAARRLADAAADIEAREIDLGIIGQFDAAIREAGRWRAETLADLDAVGEGSEDLRARVEAVYAAMVADAREASQAQREANEDWIDGVRSGLDLIRQESDTAFDVARDATIDTFRSMEDAVAEFVTTGKLSFSSFVDSVIADLARLAARRAITQPLAEALFGALPGLFGAGAGGADAVRRLQAGVGHQGAIAGQLGGVSRTVPAGVFALAPRFHRGGIAGLQPGEVPIIAQQGETILPRGTQVAAPSIEINFENRGTPQREVSREVRLDPRGMIVTVVTEDLDNGGPASQAIARRFGLRNAVA